MKAKKSDYSLSRERLSPPKIDLARLGKSSDLAPLTLVQNLSPDEFEIFVDEWLLASERYDRDEIYRLGGAGDKGRDLLARDLDGNLEQFQCKRYKGPLTPTNIYSELGKLCYYAYRGEIERPKTYWLVASHDVGSKLYDLLRKPEKLKAKLLENWTSHCQKKITDECEVELTDDFRDYVERFDLLSNLNRLGRSSTNTARPSRLYSIWRRTPGKAETVSAARAIRKNRISIFKRFI